MLLTAEQKDLLRELWADLVQSGEHGEFLREMKQEDDVVFAELASWCAVIEKEEDGS